MVIQYVYNTRWTEHPQLLIFVNKNTLRDPLHEKFAWDPARQRLYSTLCLHIQYQYLYQHHDQRKHSTMVSRDRLFKRQVSNASAIIGIGSSVMAVVSNMIWFTVSGWIWLTVFDWNWLTVFDWIRLIALDLIRLTISDLIWLTVFDIIRITLYPILFYSRLTQLSSIWVT